MLDEHYGLHVIDVTDAYADLNKINSIDWTKKIYKTYPAGDIMEFSLLPKAPGTIKVVAPNVGLPGARMENQTVHYAAAVFLTRRIFAGIHRIRDQATAEIRLTA